MIVGGGVAGATAAFTIRRSGFDGRIVVLGSERHPAYERPKLSKDLMKDGELDKVELWPLEQYEAASIELRLTQHAAELQLNTSTLVTDSGETLQWDKLLLATGGRPRRLRVPGEALGGIHYLRSVDDAVSIRDAARQARRVAIVGMGLIGSELSSSLRAMDVEVVGIDPFEAPLTRALGDEIATRLVRLQSENGTRFVRDGVAQFEGGHHVTAVRTLTGDRIECDVVLVGVGMEPNTELAARSGIQIDGGGVAVGVCGHTSAPNVFAAGDVAAHLHRPLGRYVRVEHWDNASRQAEATAFAMLGEETPYEPNYWFWSDQYGVNIQSAGLPQQHDVTVVRGDLDALDAVVFHLRGGKLVFASAINRGRDMRRALPLLRANASVSPAALANDDVDLRDLAA